MVARREGVCLRQRRAAPVPRRFAARFSRSGRRGAADMRTHETLPSRKSNEWMAGITSKRNLNSKPPPDVPEKPEKPFL